MSEYIYSAKTNAFYPLSLKDAYEHAGTWPNDGIPVTSGQYQKMMEGQSAGKVISADSNGTPVLIDIATDYIALATIERDKRMAVVTARINQLTEAQDDGDITQGEQEELANLRADRVALRRLDLTAAPDIDWP